MTDNTTDTKPQDHTVRNILLAIPALWLPAVIAMTFVFPNAAVIHHIWVGFLAANLVVWPAVLVLGLILEAVKEARRARTEAQSRREEQLPEGHPAV